MIYVKIYVCLESAGMVYESISFDFLLSELNDHTYNKYNNMGNHKISY